MLTLAALIFLQAATAPEPNAEAPTEILLACDGSTTVDGSLLDRFLGNIPHQRSYSVHVRIIGQAAMVQLPAADGGSAPGVWYPVKDLYLGAEQIIGKVRLPFGSSEFTIDRRSGVINTSGGYSGTCKKVDPQARAF